MRERNMEKQGAGSRVAALKESIKVLAKQLAGMDRRAPGRAELQQRLEDSKAELAEHGWASAKDVHGRDGQRSQRLPAIHPFPVPLLR